MSKQTVNLDAIDLGPRAPAAAPAPRPTLAPITPAPAPKDEPRVAVTTKLRPSTVKRLRRLAYETEREKQDIIEDALDRYMSERGV